MAFANFFRTGSYTKIKQILFNKKSGYIDVFFQVHSEVDGAQLIPDFLVNISKIQEKQKYIDTEIAKLTAPPNEKPEDQSQEDYNTEVFAYTEATQEIIDNADEQNSYSQFFTKDALYETSNIEECIYNWCKELDIFEGVTDA